MTVRQHQPRFVRQRVAGAVTDALRAEAHHRDERTVDEWIAAEREAVATAANQHAAAYGYPATMTVERVAHLEVTCVGHVDYADKLGMLVAEDLVP